MLCTELLTKERKPVCRFCKTNNYEMIFNPFDNEMQNYCSFCDAWTTLVFAAPAYIKAKPQKRFFCSKPPAFRGASSIEVVSRSNLPELVKLWAIYRSKSESESDFRGLWTIVATQVRRSLNVTIVNRAKRSIASCTKFENMDLEVCTCYVVLQTTKAMRADKEPNIKLIAEKLGISEQTIYVRRKFKIVNSKTNAMVSKVYRPPVMRLIDEIQKIIKGLELSWQMGGVYQVK